jgi:hypothetical protein
MSVSSNNPTTVPICGFAECEHGDLVSDSAVDKFRDFQIGMRAVHETVRKNMGAQQYRDLSSKQPGYEQAKYMPSNFLPENMTAPSIKDRVQLWNLETLSDHTNKGQKLWGGEAACTATDTPYDLSPTSCTTEPFRPEDKQPPGAFLKI